MAPAREEKQLYAQLHEEEADSLTRNKVK